MDKYKFTHFKIDHSQTFENDLQNKNADGKKTKCIQRNKN